MAESPELLKKAIASIDELLVLEKRKIELYELMKRGLQQRLEKYK